jgi:signal transduction histidine kinase/CheY-like chemotaxis protein
MSPVSPRGSSSRGARKPALAGASEHDPSAAADKFEWLLAELPRFRRMLQGPRDLMEVLPSLLSALSSSLGAEHTGLHRPGAGGEGFELLASHGAPRRPANPDLLERSAREGRQVMAAPDGAQCIVVQPITFEGNPKAVLEIVLAHPVPEAHLLLLDVVAEQLGAAISIMEGKLRTEALLARYQSITTELQAQQEQLRGQEAKLRAANEELQSRALALSEEMRQVEQKNRDVERAKAAVEEKAEQLALSSRYKSEFLANMSHELRTPLNSLLILAKLLSDNHERNLSNKQVEYARTILAAGSDLLSLINDILDLAKVESGTVTLNITRESFADLHEYVEQTFRPMAAGKGLDFSIVMAPGLQATMDTDSKRLRQILRNLLSNAFKFTERGTVTLEAAPAAGGWTSGHALDRSGPVVSFSVIDTGIGIPEDKQKLIFEEFQQADGTTSRQYGGTGLGLSISRELARLLGGEIQVRSAPGKGSTFVLYVPLVHEWMRSTELGASGEGALHATGAPTLNDFSGARTADDRKGIEAGDRVALLMETDPARATILVSLVRELGFKGLIAGDATAAGLIAKDIAPDLVLLPVPGSPAARGGPAVGALLEAIARDPAAARVPVRLFGTNAPDEGCLGLETVWSSAKPPARQSLHEALGRARRLSDRYARRMLLADGDEVQREALSALLREEEFEVVSLQSGASVLECMAERKPDVALLGPAMSDMSTGELLARLVAVQGAIDTPLICYRAGDAFAPPRIQVDAMRKHPSLRKALTELAARLDEDSRGLMAENESPAGPPAGPEQSDLTGKKALIIDDDIRNIFALTSALEHYGMRVAYAESAKQGIEMLKRESATSVALVDVMMPEIDGYDAIRIIRGMREFAELPIIAVTAKAMKGDRDKCIAAGASDYLAKPVKIEQLLSLLHAWVK